MMASEYCFFECWSAVVCRLGGRIAASVILASSKLLDLSAVVDTIFNGKKVRNLDLV